jgi:SH3-like domain-containing protein
MTEPLRRMYVTLFVVVMALVPAYAAAPAKDTAHKAAPKVDTAPSPSAPDSKQPPAAAPPAPGVGDQAPAEGGEAAEVSGLPIPRYVSLRTDPVNLRSGPGLRYPVEWVYHRKHLPVEVIGEFDTWRRIRDPDGTDGWVHQTMITGRRTAMVRGTQGLYRSDGDTSSTVATLEAGVIVNVQRCPAGSAFCRVEVDGRQGWLKREQMWGVYPSETVE